MRKNKGFVMIETIVVITILSVGLISLYASYSLILTSTSRQSKHDSVSYVYKAYFVGKYLSDNNQLTFSGNFKNVSIVGVELTNITNNFNIEKIYLAKGSFNNITTSANLLTLDGSSIAYIRTMNSYDESKINVIVKFKENNTDPVLNITNFASVSL